MGTKNFNDGFLTNNSYEIMDISTLACDECVTKIIIDIEDKIDSIEPYIFKVSPTISVRFTCTSINITPGYYEGIRVEPIISFEIIVDGVTECQRALEYSSDANTYSKAFNKLIKEELDYEDIKDDGVNLDKCNEYFKKVDNILREFLEW